MPYEKGKSGNPAGRKRGTRNRTTAEIQSALLRLLDSNMRRLQGDVESMKPKDRANILISLAKHCTPPAVNPEKLTEEQLQQIIDYLKKNERV